MGQKGQAAKGTTVLKRFRPTTAQMAWAKELNEEVQAFDWSEHTQGEEEPQEARSRHYNQLKQEHANDPEYPWQANNQGQLYPGSRLLFTLPMWREVINVASIPNRLRPSVYELPARQEYKRRHNDLNDPFKQEGGASNLCTKCTKPHTYAIHFTRRCDGCFQISLEAIFFAYHPLSKWSGMDPNDAVYLIKRCLAEDWDVLTFATAHQGDHATDDLDPKLPYNRKIESVSTILKLVPRMQEVKLGDVKFRNTDSHARKGLMEGDFVRNTAEIRALLHRRKDATVAYARNLNVDELLKFTEPLRDPVHGGTNFNLKEFLYAVLPYWETLAKDLTPAPRQIKSPIVIMVKDQVDQILQGMGNIALGDGDVEVEAAPGAKRFRNGTGALMSEEK